MNKAEFFNKISRLCKKREYRFNKANLANLLSPCVYVYLRENEALYVGMSKQGLLRALSFKENKYWMDLPKEADELLVFPVDDEKTAREAERMFIQELQPKYNIIGKA